MSDPIPTPPPVVKNSAPTLLEKITLIKSAWSSLAPDVQYGGMTLAAYTQAVAPYVAVQAALALGKVNRAGAVVAKDNADAASLAILNATVSGIKADSNFGPDSALYRACGYVTNSERSAPTPAIAGAPVVKKPSMAMFERLARVTKAWEQLAPEAEFAGRTLSEFQSATADSFLRRADMEILAAHQSGAISTRDAAETLVRRINQKVVASVIIIDGKASPVYHAMGYVNVG